MNTTAGRSGKALGTAAMVATALITGTGSAAGIASTDRSTAARTAGGEVTFDCILEPFVSGFRYQGEVAVVAPRSVEAESTVEAEDAVELVGVFPDLPGIAPVAIDGGTMRVSATASVGGQDVVLEGSSTVDAEPKADVPVPRLRSTVTMDEATAEVQLSRFSFAFDKMMGIHISAECEVTEGGDLGTLSAEARSSDDGEVGDAGSGQVAGAEAEAEASVSALLWAGPLGLLVVALLVWLPMRRRRSGGARRAV